MFDSMEGKKSWVGSEGRKHGNECEKIHNTVEKVEIYHSTLDR